MDDDRATLAACRTEVFSRVATSVISPGIGKLPGRRAGAEAILGLFKPAIGLCPAERHSQAGIRVNMRLMFQAMVTRLHSPRTFSRPRIENCRKPITDLMMPNTGSGVCLRSA
jgi:hypothetical protein